MAKCKAPCNYTRKILQGAFIKKLGPIKSLA